ncbi:hypothetical protein LTR56_007137 [Elasticomyces elasticus]|nr:hypothetical protein LTR22_020442 [Elasticomyces elasticus]KAK3649005.1 hypothetical protein LTR56_007137 [Elasticomyces elasticus]KAK4917795.1 hypothetical protein LTR49_014332 [Elasticomyces elasticus]KAK5740465.1 hypothetical protein LTS12_024953 [Elasticomyces elasticus]
MAFQRDFVFVSGLDKSYSSRKRALVRRKVHGNQTLSSDQELQLVQRHGRIATQQQLSPASAGTSSPEEEDEHVEAERIALSSSRMDVQTGGMLSAASHCLEEQRLRHINETSHSFDDVCLDEVSSFYTAAYKNAIRRQDSGASLSVLFAPETNFYALLARGAASRPTVRISALLYANIILLDCGSDINAVHARFKKSTLLARLLETGNGTTEALAFALLTADRIGGGHAIENHTRAAKLVRCLYAYNRITRHLQVQVETALMSFLPADLANMETVWDPARLQRAVSKDVNHPGVLSAEE